MNKRTPAAVVLISIALASQPALGSERLAAAPNADAAERQEGGKEALALTALDRIGFVVGAPVWLRQPWDGIPGLTKVTITSIRAEMDTFFKFRPENNKSRVYVTFLPCADESRCSQNKVIFETDDILRDAREVTDVFYVKDPSRALSKWGKRTLQAIAEQKIHIGMTAEQARTSWGRPDTVNRSVGSWGTHEQWVYGRSYLYFQNGSLTSLQN